MCAYSGAPELFTFYTDYWQRATATPHTHTQTNEQKHSLSHTHLPAFLPLKPLFKEWVQRESTVVSLQELHKRRYTHTDNESAICGKSLSSRGVLWWVKQLHYSDWLTDWPTHTHTHTLEGSDQIGDLIKRPPRKRTPGHAGPPPTHTHLLPLHSLTCVFLNYRKRPLPSPTKTYFSPHPSFIRLLRLLSGLCSCSPVRRPCLVLVQTQRVVQELTTAMDLQCRKWRAHTTLVSVLPLHQLGNIIPAGFYISDWIEGPKWKKKISKWLQAKDRK